MGVEIIKDRQGRDHLVMSDEDFYNDDIMGDKLEDYEILQLLSKNIKDSKDSSYVSKVKSKFNSKIYAMKCYNTNENIESEFNNFQKVNDPNIVKYFKHFHQNGKLYIIFEYISSTDLNGFLKAYESLKKPIDINTRWIIFMQCISALRNIHQKHLIHKNISLSNIFMTENKVIKLGDFRFSFYKSEKKENKDFLSPEFNKNHQYNEKTDIYAMGIVFQKLCCEDNSSKEMENIINLMLKEESQRPNAEILYNLISNEYIKNVAKLTSINSVFRCMFSFLNFSQEMYVNSQAFSNINATPVSFNYLKCIEQYNQNKNQNDVALFLNNFRNLLYENIPLNNDMEIKPLLVIEFFLEKLNKETGNNYNCPSFKIQPVIFEENKDEAFSQFDKYFQNNFISTISKYFIGFIKTKRICAYQMNQYQCRQGIYSFNLFPFIEFDLDRCDLSKNLEDWFELQNNNCFILSQDHNIICKKCQAVKEHREFKQFYKMPQNLIISFNRGEGFRNSSPINYPFRLNLIQKIEKGQFFSFNLVGIIKRVIDNKGEDYYISLNFDPNKGWILSQKNNLSIVNPAQHNEGMVMVLFYSGINQTFGS